MTLELIGDLIDKLSIINIKIWDATEKAHLLHEKDKQKEANELFHKIEMMNVQRKEYINEINSFFSNKKNHLYQKSFIKEKNSK